MTEVTETHIHEHSNNMPRLNYPWHQQSYAHVQTLLHENRMPHALLFRRRAAYFDTALGWQWARLLLCDNQRGDDGCQHCHLMNERTHPNVLFLDVINEKVGIEQIRELEQQMWQTAVFDKPKIAFIDGIDLLSIAAQNALLKTLEEPPKSAFFILGVSNLSRVLPTIMSRVQRIRHDKVSKHTVLHWLQQVLIAQNLPQTEAEIGEIAQLVEFAPERALALLTAPEEVTALQQEKQQFAQFMSGKCSASVLVASTVAEDTAEKLQRYCGYVERLIRVLFEKKAQQADKLDDNSVEYQRWHGVSLASLYRLHDILMEMRRLTDSNVNMSMQLTSSLTDWQNDRRK